MAFRAHYSSIQNALVYVALLVFLTVCIGGVTSLVGAPRFEEHPHPAGGNEADSSKEDQKQRGFVPAANKESEYQSQHMMHEKEQCSSSCKAIPEQPYYEIHSIQSRIWAARNTSWDVYVMLASRPEQRSVSSLDWIMRWELATRCLSNPEPDNQDMFELDQLAIRGYWDRTWKCYLTYIIGNGTRSSELRQTEANNE